MNRLKRLADQKTGISLRHIAPKFNVNISTISRQLKHMGIMYRKRKRAPKYTEKQVQEIPTRARRLYRTLCSDNFELILDDEKYFLLHNESISANRGFYTSDSSVAPPEVKFKFNQKFEPKIMVWIAVSESGISKPYFAQQHQATTEKIYLNKCIKARLIPFIETYHSKEKVLFWPDLARSNYARQVIDYLMKNGISVVSQQNNPQNCPQARPIESLWSILDQLVYAHGWEAKSIEHLKRRIVKKLHEVDIKVVQAMFSDIRKQLRRIADKGPNEACSF